MGRKKHDESEEIEIFLPSAEINRPMYVRRLRFLNNSLDSARDCIAALKKDNAKKDEQIKELSKKCADGQTLVSILDMKIAALQKRKTISETPVEELLYELKVRGYRGTLVKKETKEVKTKV